MYAIPAATTPAVRFRLREYDGESSDTGLDFWLTDDGIIAVTVAFQWQILASGVLLIAAFAAAILFSDAIGVGFLGAGGLLALGVVAMFAYFNRARARLKELSVQDLDEVGRVAFRVGWTEVLSATRSDVIFRLDLTRQVGFARGAICEMRANADEADDLDDFLRLKLGQRMQ